MASPSYTQDFIDSIKQSAIDSMLATGIPASFVVAEGALESSWGRSGLTLQANNLFGVKADKSWHGPIFEMKTREFINGQWVIETAEWRKYGTWLECLNDHALFFMTNSRYAKAMTCTDGLSFAKTVADAGYATDPSYFDKIKAVIASHNLLTLDSRPLSTPSKIALLPMPPAATAPSVTAPSKPSGGFFAWLKKLF